MLPSRFLLSGVIGNAFGKTSWCRRSLWRTLCSSSSSSPPNGTHLHVAGHPTLPSLDYDPFTCLIPDTEYRNRQLRLINLVSKSLRQESPSLHKCLLVVPAARKGFQAFTKIPQLNFKQNGDFIYLTGLNCIEASDSVLVMILDQVPAEDNESPDIPKMVTFRSLLFVPFFTEKEVIWEGQGIHSPDFNRRLSNICDSLENVKYVDSFISESTSDKKSRIFVTKGGIDFGDNKCLVPGENSTIVNKQPVSNLTPLIDELRVIKSETEIKAMKRTCRIGARALSATREFTRNVMSTNGSGYDTGSPPHPSVHTSYLHLINESQVAAKFDYESRISGAVKLAYPSVVAGGPRSTVIHYGSCNKFMTSNDWLLMDAGCEDVEGYVSDITRCWILGGDTSSTSHIRLTTALYEALVEVQEHLINQLKSADFSPSSTSTSSMSLDYLFEIMCHLLGRVCVEFGIIPKSSSAAESARAGYKFCPHHVSHYLGLDVHDTPSIPRNVPLRPGMCFTIEPGLYFRPNDQDVKKEFRGIGLRVEDDLIIESSSPKEGETSNHSTVTVLTKDCAWIS